MLSPVEVSARIIAKFREEWDRAQGAPLAEQDIVLTVPASFDEEARELTVMAARDAGLEKLTLLEEPAAAFYSWIANNLAQSRKKLFDGQIGAGVRRGRRHQRLQPDPRFARRRPGRTSRARRWASTCCWAATTWI